MTDIERSNSLTDLAARIKTEHEAVSVALKDSVRHAITAGELLLEAKKQLNKHGQWLPWLEEHCTISKRTAQLYMRCAKNREEIEKRNALRFSDLTLSEAAAMLMLSSDVKKLFEFMEGIGSLTDPEEIIQFCAEKGVATISNPFGDVPEPTAQETVEWRLFSLFLVQHCGYGPEAADYHMDWVQSRGTLLSEWMGEVGIRMNKNCGVGPAPETVDAWKIYLDANRNRTLESVAAEFKREINARRELLKSALAGNKLSKKNRRLAEDELWRMPADDNQKRNTLRI